MSLKQSQIITCRGAVCWGAGEGLKVEEIQVEPPHKGEVRVRMLRASLCHSDLLMLGGYYGHLYPRIVGHEGVGVIESVGEGVVGLAEGDTVIPTLLGECKQCPNCLSTTKTNICFAFPVTADGLMADKTSRMSVAGRQLFHAISCSTFCEFTVVNANYVVKMDTRVPLSHASILSCGFSTGFGAAWKEARIDRGATVAVLGLGAVGLGAVCGAKLLGASRIIGVDVNARREAPARGIGLTDFVNPEDTADKAISEVIKEMTGGLGVDYSFECTGVEKLLAEALAATVPGRGTTVVLGAGKHQTATVGFMDLLAGRTLKGSIFGGIKPCSELPTIYTRCADKEFDLDPLVTHEIGLSEISRALEIVKQPDCLKLVIRFDKI